MNTHSNEKHGLEKAAICIFLPLYNDRFDKRFRLVQMTDRPDAILEDQDGTRIGLEVAHLFYPGGREARLLLRRATGVHGVQTFDRLIDELNRLLYKKAEARSGYACPYPVLLLIRNASPIWSGPDFIKARDMLRAPVGVYHEIWLLARDDKLPGGPHLIKIG